MPRCTPDLPPPLVIDAVLRALPLRIPTEVAWLRVLATPPEDAGSLLVDCMRCALEEAPPLPEAPPDPPPVEGITQVTLRRAEWWHEAPHRGGAPQDERSPSPAGDAAGQGVQAVGAGGG
jgi:hypothetical protein